MSTTKRDASYDTRLFPCYRGDVSCYLLLVSIHFCYICLYFKCASELTNKKIGKNGRCQLGRTREFDIRQLTNKSLYFI